ncbi:NAD(P)/FAD-dependent oxidoreductase [Clostridium guangxiense]|uniref:NAD(P)/FAD-dependent oxidoreductase n=1 Tax=Clostridium guangxiense TaxID=1662055 RepID=UPI001E4C304C|nr:FAD-dependent oxidoreductase [Clostridium guangxiense]
MACRIIIVGAGVAAVNAIKAIREYDKESEIILIGDEKFYPYSRIKLTKSMLENLEEDKILLQKKDWYAANNVSLYLGRSVIKVDTDNHKVILDDESKFSYKKLLLASGAHNFIPPIQGIEKPGVYSIRKLEDIKKLQDTLREKEVILNIGGGIQGLETAWVLHQHGKKIIIVEFQNRLMPAQLDDKASRTLQRAIESFNIEVHLNTQVKTIVGESEVKEALTNSGDNLKCDMVVYSVGIRTNIDFLQDSLISLNHGVIVNNMMQTKLKDVYAAGDVAEFEGKISGSWSAAANQGKIAGYNIAGKEVKYSGIVPVTTLNAFNISLFSIGNVDEKQCSTTLTDGDDMSLSYKRIFIKDNHIVGAIIIGDAKKLPLLKKVIENKVDITKFTSHSMSVSELIDKLKG